MIFKVKLLYSLVYFDQVYFDLYRFYPTLGALFLTSYYDA